VKPLAWYLNVVPRTVRAFAPALARPDDDFARGVLEGPELRLYLAMDPRDRVHAVAVARAYAARRHGDRLGLRAALLHDVGKSTAPYRAWERILVHLYTPARLLDGDGGRGLAGAWRRHRLHPERGAAMIVAAGGDPDVADLVARHHRPGSDSRLRLLAALDEGT
jgi:hypothetical protein